jgi:tellurite resistance-related uncharacterized protein
MPTGHVPYKRTPAFRRETIPAGLLHQHETKPGVWAILSVIGGNLEFFEATAAGETRTALVAGANQVILPEVRHRVAAQGEVEFNVEFWRAG